LAINQGADQMMLKPLLLAVSLATMPSLVLAQDTMQGMQMGSGPAQEGYMKAMQTMMEKTTSMEMTGDADKDFVMMMIPHHQAAIDMAKVELQEGKDPKIKKMAQMIIRAQEKEIAEMKRWQASHQ
jgi:uncharacterized protein (DUF305 family)